MWCACDSKGNWSPIVYKIVNRINGWRAQHKSRTKQVFRFPFVCFASLVCVQHECSALCYDHFPAEAATTSAQPMPLLAATIWICILFHHFFAHFFLYSRKKWADNDAHLLRVTGIIEGEIIKSREWIEKVNKSRINEKDVQKMNLRCVSCISPYFERRNHVTFYNLVRKSRRARSLPFSTIFHVLVIALWMFSRGLSHKQRITSPSRKKITFHSFQLMVFDPTVSINGDPFFSSFKNCNSERYSVENDLNVAIRLLSNDS